MHGGFLSQEKANRLQEAKFKKEAAKLKKEGKGILNALTVPFAKFEVEVMVMTSSDPGCPLLDHAKEIVKDGKRFKDAANRCLAGHGACEVKMPEVNVWLKDVTAATKSLQALADRG